MDVHACETPFAYAIIVNFNELYQQLSNLSDDAILTTNRKFSELQTWNAGRMLLVSNVLLMYT